MPTLVETKYEFDKQTYLDIKAKDGLPAAITALHARMRDLESECFEGREGYQPALYEELKQLRDFSVELWDSKLND